MSEGNYGYWLFNGTNGLRGAPSTIVFLSDGRRVIQKDPDNPAVLEDEFIAYSLRTSRQARSDFCRLFPTLDVESQERLTDLILQNPRATSLMRNDQDFTDAIQHENVTEGVRSRLTDVTRPRNEGVEDRVPSGGAR